MTDDGSMVTRPETLELSAGGWQRLRALLEAAAVAATIAGIILAFEAVGYRGYRGEIALGAAALLATFFLRREGHAWSELGLRRPRSWSRALSWAASAMFGIFLAVSLVQAVLVRGLGLAPADLSRNAIEGDILGYLVRVTVISWGTAAFLEEMVARGFLIDRFAVVFGRVRWSRALAVGAQALLFGAAHPSQGPAGMITAGTIGLVFGFVYFRAGRNLWPLIIAHGLTDMLSFTALFFGVQLGG